MAESYSHLMGTPIDPDEMFYKDGSKADPKVGDEDAVLAQNARMMNANQIEMRYISSQKKVKTKY